MPDDAPNRVNVSTSDLKVGDVLETSVRRYVVVRSYKNEHRKTEINVLGENGAMATFTDSPNSTMDGLHLRIGTGCEPTLEGLERFISNLS